MPGKFSADIFAVNHKADFKKDYSLVLLRELLFPIAQTVS